MFDDSVKRMTNNFAETQSKIDNDIFLIQKHFGTKNLKLNGFTCVRSKFIKFHFRMKFNSYQNGSPSPCGQTLSRRWMFIDFYRAKSMNHLVTFQRWEKIYRRDENNSMQSIITTIGTPNENLMYMYHTCNYFAAGTVLVAVYV